MSARSTWTTRSGTERSSKSAAGVVRRWTPGEWIGSGEGAL